MSETAKAHGGVVDKFVGDNALIVMGVPEAQDDDAARTLACARTLLARIAAWNAGPTPPPLAGAPLRIGIGAHFGPAFVGAVGTDERLEFTVLGDTVNVASRLEQLTRETDGGLIASAPLLAAAGEEAGNRAGQRHGYRPLAGARRLGDPRPARTPQCFRLAVKRALRAGRVKWPRRMATYCGVTMIVILSTFDCEPKTVAGSPARGSTNAHRITARGRSARVRGSACPLLRSPAANRASRRAHF